MSPMNSWKILALTGALAAGCAAEASEPAAGFADPLGQEAVDDAAPAAPAAAAPAPARAAAASLTLPNVKESPNVAPWFNVYRPTDLTATGQPLPVVVWANGGCFRSDFTWATLYQRWAGGGFIVLALNESATTPALSQTTVKDQRGLVDWIVKQNETEGSPYFGKVDTKRIVAAGNSCGGITALGLTAEDSRIAAAFVLSGSSAMPFAGRNAAQTVMSKIKVPVGYVVGGPQDIAGANATNDYGYLAAGIPGAIVSRNAGDHQTVSTDAKILPEVAKISLDWLDLALYGTASAYQTLTSPTVCSGCASGTWKLTAKSLETLRK